LKTKYSKASGAGGRKIPKTLSGIETGADTANVSTTHAAKYLKPYQGLKLNHTLSDTRYTIAAKYLKPYQGLKPKPAHWGGFAASRKIPKTLSGIETVQQERKNLNDDAAKYLKPYQGLKLQSNGSTGSGILPQKRQNT